MKYEPSIWIEEKLINSDAHSLNGIRSGWCEIWLINLGIIDPEHCLHNIPMLLRKLYLVLL